MKKNQLRPAAVTLIRDNLCTMEYEEFACLLNVDKDTVKMWECGLDVIPSNKVTQLNKLALQKLTIGINLSRQTAKEYAVNVLKEKLLSLISDISITDAFKIASSQKSIYFQWSKNYFLLLDGHGHYTGKYIKLSFTQLFNENAEHVNFFKILIALFNEPDFLSKQNESDSLDPASIKYLVGHYCKLRLLEGAEEIIDYLIAVLNEYATEKHFREGFYSGYRK